MSTLKVQVGVLVRHHRKHRGWSQDELAARAHRSVEMINRIERGRIAPSFDTLEALAGALGVGVRDFFEVGGVAVSSMSDGPLARLVERVSVLDAADQAWVEDLVRVALCRKSRS